jgi:hypothetical protein
MDTNKILADLRAQRERVNQAIAALEALNGTAVSGPKSKTPAKATKATVTKATAVASGTKSVAKKRVISPEGRKRMAEAQQKRWAKKAKATKSA